MDQADEFGVRWNPRDNGQRKGESYRVIRAPTTGTIALQILSHRVTEVDTHWWNARTQGCRGDQCQACLAGELPRRHGYLIAQNVQSRERVIVEVTEGPIDRLETAFSQSRTLRGWTIHLQRVGGKTNGKVIVKFMDQLEVAQRDLLPQAPELQAVLHRIWGWTTAADQAKKKKKPPADDAPDQHFGIVD